MTSMCYTQTVAKVFTIGYAGIELPQFIDVLQQNGVTLLIDVRSVPRSRYFAAYNDTVLSKELAKYQIRYEHWREFGARQLDYKYETIASSAPFQRALQRLKNSHETVCLMCAEIDPINCHRFILVGRYLDDVTNIIAKRNGAVVYETKSATAERINGDYDQQGAKIAYKA